MARTYQTSDGNWGAWCETEGYEFLHGYGKTKQAAIESVEELELMVLKNKYPQKVYAPHGLLSALRKVHHNFMHPAKSDRGKYTQQDAYEQGDTNVRD